MSDTIQLDKLPPPDVVEALDYEILLGQARQEMQTRWPAFSATVESDPIHKCLEVLAFLTLQERQKKNDGARACYLATAQGADLENWAANLGTYRLTIRPGDPERGIAPTLESDEALRYRCALASSGFSVAGPSEAYEYFARSASGQVLDARVFSPAPGEVVVSVMAREGDGTASTALLDTVRVSSQ